LFFLPFIYCFKPIFSFISFISFSWYLTKSFNNTSVHLYWITPFIDNMTFLYILIHEIAVLITFFWFIFYFLPLAFDYLIIRNISLFYLIQFISPAFECTIWSHCIGKNLLQNFCSIITLLSDYWGWFFYSSLFLIISIHFSFNSYFSLSLLISLLPIIKMTRLPYVSFNLSSIWTNLISPVPLSCESPP